MLLYLHLFIHTYILSSKNASLDCNLDSRFCLWGSSLAPATSAVLPTKPLLSIDATNWPEGPQVRKEIRFHEPDGWAHSNWPWRSSGYVDHPGSLHPKLGKAECRRCLGVLQCRDCGKVMRPSTKTAGMRAQLSHDCPDVICHGALLWISCEARTYHFVVEEDSLQYSVWKHTGSHESHPRPPSGRRPPRSVPSPPASARIVSQPVVARTLTNPLANPRAAVSRSQTPHGDAEELIQSKRAASVTIPWREDDTFPVVACNGCGEVRDGGENEAGPSNLAWSCPDCRGVVVWRDNKWVTRRCKLKIVSYTVLF